MNRRLWVSLPLVVLCLAGAFISKLLLDKHLFKSAGPAWFASVCGEQPATAPSDDEQNPDDSATGRPTSRPRDAGDARSPDCAAVLASRWATLPPRDDVSGGMIDASPADQQGLHVPVAFIGLVYFLSLTVWFLFIGRPTPDQRQWHLLPLVFVLGGIMFSALYLGLMLLGMDEWCPWCLATHGINLLILIGTLLLRPARASLQTSALSGAPSAVPPGDSDSSLITHLSALGSHPSGRLVGACVALAAAVGSAAAFHYSALNAVGKERLAKKQIEHFVKDSDFLTAIYFSKPLVEIAVREDDPQTSRDEDFCKLVVFSDFACPGCRSFAWLVKKKLETLFQNHIRLIWKHYPLSSECNPHAPGNKHPEACQAARAAEAARLLGGNEAFWKAHDRLFEAQRRLKEMDYAELARDLGLDAERFLSEMNSPAVAQRIAEDAAQGKKLGVAGTPTVFLMNRQVDPLLAKVTHFWELMSASFNYDYDDKTYKEKMKRLEAEGKLPPTTQDDHAGHGHD